MANDSMAVMNRLEYFKAPQNVICCALAACRRIEFGPLLLGHLVRPEAALPLLERGLDVREMYGGMRTWKTLKFSTEPVDSEALAGQHEPLAV